MISDPHQEAEAETEDAATVLFNRYRKSAHDQGHRRLARPPKNTSMTADPRAASRAAAAGAAGSRQGDLRDPKPLGAAVKGLIRSRGWSAPVAVGSVISRWDQLVGASIAEHCTPQSFEDGVVVVLCDSTAWATNLKLMRGTLMEVFERELGKGIVTEIDIRGPQAPSWKRGRFTVRGGRGPRDTYG